MAKFSKHTFFSQDKKGYEKALSTALLLVLSQMLLEVDQSQAPHLRTYTQTHKHHGKHPVFSTFVTVAGSTYLWASCSIVSGRNRNNSLLSFCQHGAEKH